MSSAYWPKRGMPPDVGVGAGDQSGGDGVSVRGHVRQDRGHVGDVGQHDRVGDEAGVFELFLLLDGVATPDHRAAERDRGHLYGNQQAASQAPRAHRREPESSPRGRGAHRAQHRGQRGTSIPAATRTTASASLTSIAGGADVMAGVTGAAAASVRIGTKAGVEEIAGSFGGGGCSMAARCLSPSVMHSVSARMRGVWHHLGGRPATARLGGMADQCRST